MRISKIRSAHVDSFPKTLEDGVLYISWKFKTAAHRCACGCGTKIVTPLRPTEYKLIESRGRVTILPSIGNWNHPCQSHYVIRDSQIQWAGQWTEQEIARGRARDESDKYQYFGALDRPWWADIWDWIKSLLR